MKRQTLIYFILIIIISIVAIAINLTDPITIKNKAFNWHFNGIDLTQIGINRDLSFKKGLDLEGGTSVTLRADMKDIPEDQREDALESAKTVIERRINFFGVSEPLIQTSKIRDDYRIITEIPGITDSNTAINLIGRTAKLTFWEESASEEEILKMASDSAEIASNSAIPLGLTQLFYKPKQTNLNGSDLKQASVTFDPNTGKPQVQLTFTGEGGKKFGEITKRNVGKIVAIALDDRVVESPRVNEPIYGGNAVITGEFTTDQAKTVQIQLNAGALPVSLSVLQQQAIGATLGKESLEKSLVAGFMGFFVIVIFMIVLYGKKGIVASLALALYTLILLSIFRLVPITLTLAGIAGLILSIGIAVDANVLIFERLKEELRRGRAKDLALEIAFKRAWPSIRDSNIASLITCLVLYYFGTGIVRGFALTLALGVIVSMFSAIFVTKTFLKVGLSMSLPWKKKSKTIKQ